MKSNLTSLLKVATTLSVNLDLSEGIAAVRSWKPDENGPANGDQLLKSIQVSSRSTADTLQFFYAGTVITLYGALEKFVEDLVVDTAQRIAEASPTYDDLPEGLAKHHTQLTLEVLGQIATERYHGNLLERDLVAGLHHVLGPYSPVRVNAGVFSRHTANLRWPIIRHLFDRISVPIAGLEHAPEFCKAMEDHFPDEGNMFFVIDDLARRRNEVSHGWGSDVLSIEIMRAYVKVIEAFATSLLAIASSSVANQYVEHFGLKLGKPDKVYRRNIAGYHSIPHRVEVGDTVAVLNSGNARCSRVVDVQCDGESVEVANPDDSTGIKLSVEMSARESLYVLPKAASFLS